MIEIEERASREVDKKAVPYVLQVLTLYQSCTTCTKLLIIISLQLIYSGCGKHKPLPKYDLSHFDSNIKQNNFLGYHQLDGNFDQNCIYVTQDSNFYNIESDCLNISSLNLNSTIYGTFPVNDLKGFVKINNALFLSKEIRYKEKHNLLSDDNSQVIEGKHRTDFKLYFNNNYLNLQVMIIDSENKIIYSRTFKEIKI